MNKEILNKYRVVLICLGLAVLTFAAFEQVRNNDFVSYDDNSHLTDNPNVNKGLSLKSVSWAFTTLGVVSGIWHPLTWLSHMVDFQIYGLRPAGHHITSLMLHILNSLLLFWVFKKMTGATFSSAFIAALFAIHPLHVESVAWVAERKDVLSGCFWILTMVAYYYYTKHTSIVRYLLVIVFFALGLMSKPMLVTLPFVLLLLDYWPLNRFEHRPQKDKGISIPYWLVVEKIPLFILSAASCVVALIAQQRGGAVASMARISLGSRICNGLVSYVGYIQKMIWPKDLSLLYPYPVDGVGLWSGIISFMILALISVGVFVFRKQRYLAMGWFWYLGTLVPVIGFVQIGVQAMADRYTYIPLIGIFVIIAWSGNQVLSKQPHLKLVFGASAGIILIVLLILTRMQVSYWKDSTTLYKHILGATKNNFIILNNYGNSLGRDGRFEEAIEYYRKALRISPDFADAHNNLGVSLAALGKPEQAIERYQKALQLKPDHAKAHNNFGLALVALNKFKEAVEHYQKSLQLKPDCADAHNNLGKALVSLGKFEQAVERYQQALQIKPDHSVARCNLAAVFRNQGKFDQAIECYRKALQTNPDMIEAHYGLGTALLIKGSVEQAFDHFRRVVVLDPDIAVSLAGVMVKNNKPQRAVRLLGLVLENHTNHFQAHYDLAVICVTSGRFDEAIAHLRRAVAIQPDDAGVLNSLAWVLATRAESTTDDGKEAVKLASRAVQLTNGQNPQAHDTLAAAYAAAGNFPKAIETAGRALQLASDDEVLAGEIQTRLELYKSNQPFHETQPAENNTNPGK